MKRTDTSAVAMRGVHRPTAELIADFFAFIAQMTPPSPQGCVKSDNESLSSVNPVYQCTHDTLCAEL